MKHLASCFSEHPELRASQMTNLTELCYTWIDIIIKWENLALFMWDIHIYEIKW